MIAIVDYGMGNIRSVAKAFAKIGAEAAVTSDPKVLVDSRGIVLPGVGAFRDCMRNLDGLRLLDTIVKEVEKGKPYLGICLGLQILFTESEEFGICKGLDLFKGRVVRFKFSSDTPILTIAGLIQGNGWLNGETVYRIVPQIYLYMVVRASLGILVMGGAVIGLYNIFMTLRRGKGGES